jgi:hypothetical protein
MKYPELQGRRWLVPGACISQVSNVKALLLPLYHLVVQ